jgi:hypothetical protein
MRAGGLPLEREPEQFQSPDDLAVAKPGETPHQAFTING